ncbi:hypothetical protein [uncultured Pseudomonas sp.]|uniref:hypothetical protein n=1 Tax=uncultured Pseudomonas sp. TaxID=114707 RepID=UPI0025E84334|nr:hypothetical protein [uncultured Pseudomonas sp.]
MAFFEHDRNRDRDIHAGSGVTARLPRGRGTTDRPGRNALAVPLSLGRRAIVPDLRVDSAPIASKYARPLSRDSAHVHLNTLAGHPHVFNVSHAPAVHRAHSGFLQELH